MTLYNINAFEHMRSLDDNVYDCIITDPDYDKPLDISELLRVCRGNIVMFCKPENQYVVPDEYAFWLKPQSPKNNIKHLSRNVDMILILRRGETFNKLPYPSSSNYWHDILEEKQIHQHQKPLSLIERLVRIYSNPGDVIFDPFAGSGTTLVACQNLGRVVVGCEADVEHYTNAVRRIDGDK